jgi:methylated-DNA-[protein]-cysteine S-methyltransferase
VTSPVERAHLTIPTPHGDLFAIAEGGALTSLSWIDGERTPPPGSTESATPFEALQEQLDAYWDKRLDTFDVPMSLAGTPFQMDVWRALARVPFGVTVSYSQLAASVERPRAVRAVGRANGANPIAILVPCHRVIGANGSVTGYAGGIERKMTLLRHEGAWPAD